MNRMHFAGLCCLALLLGGKPAQGEPRQFDVVVYGGTSAGIAAAVQVRRMGKTVVVVEPGKHLGGLTTGGLGWTDSGNKAVIGGFAREFYQRIKQHYDQPAAWVHQQPQQYGRYRPGDDAMWTFEPHVAERIYEEYVRELGVVVVRQQRLDRQGGVIKDGQRIVSIKDEAGQVYQGKMYIDATYEGDLLAAAGVSYTVGREGNSQYNETLNGVQKRQNTHKHRFLEAVDPYIVPGDPGSGLVPGVHADDPGPEGAADQRIQAYCFRMCMSNVPANSVPFPKPAGYDERRYELLLRNFEAGDLRLPLKPDMMPNGKTDTNNNCAFSTDNIGMNYDYPDADYARRAEIVKEHEAYQKGLMWTLANHPRVPASIRREMAKWGLAKDEFVDNGHWPHQLYVREARRMVGDFVMTERDCRRIRVADDSIGMGSYNMDSHNVQRYVTDAGHVQNEGDVQVSPGGAYLISYRSIVPKRGEAENLLVPVCLSASHIAYGSIRMEPVFMVLGQSAATAAVLAMDDRIAVQEVPYPTLKDRLIADKQVLQWVGPRPAAKISLDPARMPGLVFDDDAMTRTGHWLSSSATPGFVGPHYWHDNNEGQGEKSAKFKITVITPGRYDVRLFYTPNRNRATNVHVNIFHSEGIAGRRINQRQPLPPQETSISLGKYRFEPGKPASVEITTKLANGHVIADAIQLLLQGD